MTNEQKKDNPPEITKVEIDVNASQEDPDYINDPIEKVEAWIKKVYPEDLQETVMGIIKSAREEQNK